MPPQTRNRPPDYLPPEIRDHPAVIAACHDRDLGRLFRTVNNLTEYPARFTASHLARRCAMTPSRVGEYMDGQRQATLATLERVADALHIPGQHFELAPRPWQAGDTPAGPTHHTAKRPQPPVQPPEFWRQPTMRAALQSRHFGHVIHAYRTHPWHERDITQQQAATWLGMNQASLSRIEAGRPPEEISKLVHWAGILSIPQDLLWFTPPSTTPTRHQTTTPRANRRLRQLRLARNWTYQEAAHNVRAHIHATTGHHVPVDARTIERLESGEITDLPDEYRTALRAIYNLTTDEQLGLSPAKPATHPPSALRRDPIPTGQTPIGPLADVSSAPADADAQPWQLMDALTRSNLSADTIMQLGRAVFASAARYPSTSPALLLPLVLGQLTRLRTALLNTQSLRVLRQCVQLTGILAGLAGNLYLDLGDPLQATDYFELGRAAGREAEDDALTAWVLTTQSIGPFFAGHPEQSADLLDQASRLITNTGSKRREAWINAMAARAHAACGNRDLALSSLDLSTLRLTEADEPSGIDFFDLPRLNGIAGSCHLRLGDTATSARMLHTAIEQRASTDTKGRALLVFDLAECKIVEGEIEEACHLATSALDLNPDLIVHPIADRAKAVHDGLSRWHELGPVATLTERLREAPASLPAQRG